MATTAPGRPATPGTGAPAAAGAAEMRTGPRYRPGRSARWDAGRPRSPVTLGRRRPRRRPAGRGHLADVLAGTPPPRPCWCLVPVASRRPRPPHRPQDPPVRQPLSGLDQGRRPPPPQLHAPQRRDRHRTARASAGARIRAAATASCTARLIPTLPTGSSRARRRRSAAPVGVPAAQPVQAHVEQAHIVERGERVERPAIHGCSAVNRPRNPSIPSARNRTSLPLRIR